MGNDFLTGRTRANGTKVSTPQRKQESFWGTDKSAYTNSRQASSNAGKGQFINSQTEMQNLAEELREVLAGASNAMSGYAMSIIRGDEAPSQNHVEQNMAALLAGFSVEQQRDILLKALAKVAVNA